MTDDAITSKLKKTGYRALMNGKLFDHKTATYHVNIGGIIEACYHEDTAKELSKLAAIEFSAENVGFICAINYLLCRKANVGAKTGRVAGIARHATYEEAMKKVFAEYIDNSGGSTVNIDHFLRNRLISNQEAYCSGQNISELFKGREPCLRIVFQNIQRAAKDVPVSSSLVKYLKMEQSPTDLEVRRRLSFPDWLKL